MIVIVIHVLQKQRFTDFLLNASHKTRLFSYSDSKRASIFESNFQNMEKHAYRLWGSVSDDEDEPYNGL